MPVAESFRHYELPRSGDLQSLAAATPLRLLPRKATLLKQLPDIQAQELVHSYNYLMTFPLSSPVQKS